MICSRLAFIHGKRVASPNYWIVNKSVVFAKSAIANSFVGLHRIRREDVGGDADWGGETHRMVGYHSHTRENPHRSLLHGTRLLTGSLQELFPLALTARRRTQTFWPVGRPLRSKRLFLLVSAWCQEVPEAFGSAVAYSIS